VPKRAPEKRAPKPMPKFDEIRSDIETDLSLLRVVYRDKSMRSKVLRSLRRARAALLVGELGVNGQLWAIHNACEDAAEEIRAGADPTVAVRESITALGYHRLRIPKRGGRGALLIPALLTDSKAIAALVRAASHMAFPKRYDAYKSLTRELIHEAAVAVGLQRASRNSKTRPGDETPAAKSVRVAIDRATKLNAEGR